MDGNYYKVQRGELTIWCKLHTLNFYWPFVRIGKEDFMLIFKTMLFVRPKKNWEWLYAAGFILFGFGIGWAYNHYSNPNYDEDMYKQRANK